MTVEPEVLTGLSSSDDEKRRAALDTLLHERDLRTLPDLRRIEASDESEELRLVARRAMLNLAGALPPGEDRRTTVRAPPLDDPDPSKRLLAVAARAVRGRPEDVERLVSRIDSEQDPIVRSELTLAIGAAGGKGCLAHLERLLDDSHPDVRLAALEGLGLMHDPCAYPHFVRYARDLDNRMRTFSLRALAKLGRASVLRLCQAMCKSNKEGMVFSGAHLLAGLKDPSYLPIFEELLKYPSADVREKAREGIEQIASTGDEHARALLKQIKPEASAARMPLTESRSRKIPLPDLGADGLRDPDPAVRLKHIQSIENRKDLASVPALVARLILETDVRVLATLVSTVGRMGDSSVIDELELLLDSPNDRVRANVVESIGLLAPIEERRRLVRSLSDLHHRVRANAILALWGSTYGGVRDALLALGTQTDKRCKLAAIYTIGQIGEPASSLLHALLVDKDPEVVQRARECRQKIGLIESVEEPTPVATGPALLAPVAESRPTKIKGLKEWVSKREEARVGALRDLAEAYRERVGKELVAPSDLGPLLGEVTLCWQKLKRDKPETRTAYNQRLETLGRTIRERKLWRDGLGVELLTRLDTLDAELDVARAELTALGRTAGLFRRWVLVGLALVLVAYGLACFLGFMP